MKRITILLGALLLTIVLLGGCGVSENDRKFLDTVEKSIQTRYEEQEKKYGKDDKSSDQNALCGYIEGESDMFREFKNFEFSDEKLGALAKDYINGIEIQEKAYEQKDDYRKLWDVGGHKRVLALRAFIEDYSISVPDGTKKYVEEWAEYMEEKEAYDLKIKNALNNAEIEIIGNDCAITVKNPADKTVKGFSVEVKFINSKGIVIDTDTNYYISDWYPDEEIRLEFMTSEDFYTMEVKEFSYYYFE